MKSEFKIYETTAVDWSGDRYYVQLEERQARRNCRPKYGVRAFRAFVGTTAEPHSGEVFSKRVERPTEPNRWFESEEEALAHADYILAKFYGGNLGGKLLDGDCIALLRTFVENREESFALNSLLALTLEY